MCGTRRGFFYLPLRFSFAALVLFALTSAAAAQTYFVLHSFTGGADGAYPSAALTMDVAGTLYGTASGGGATGGDCTSYGCGTVFKFAHRGSGWVLTPLYGFTGGGDGRDPGAIIIGPDGSLYGVTFYGGVSGCAYGYGCGTVFNVRLPAPSSANVLGSWTETVLYRFTGGSDGANPTAALIFDQARNIYGASSCGLGGCGGNRWARWRLVSAPGGCATSVWHLSR